MENLVQIFKALSDKTRLRIVSALMEYDELCACQLVELIQATGATVSRHLSVLSSAKLIDSRKEGRWVYYSLNSSSIASLRPVIEQSLQNDTQRHKDISILEQITSVELEALCRKQRGANCC